MIDIEHVSKHYVVDGRDIPAITDINLRVEQGEIFGIIGASGAGKSTLIRTLNLLERPDSGRIWSTVATSQSCRKPSFRPTAARPG